MNHLKIEREFDAAPVKVFAVFTLPEDMRIWWTEDTEFDIDLRVGGKYTITRQEGETTLVMTGEYLQVEPFSKLKYTCGMPDFSPVFDIITIEIVPNGRGGSRMTFIQEGEGIQSELQDLPEGEVSPSEQGWQMGFDLMRDHWNAGK